MLELSLTNMDDIRGAANVFTFGKFRDILLSDDLSYVRTKAQKLFELENIEYNFSEIIKHIYDALLNNYRNEYVYKNEIVNQLLIKKHNLTFTTLIDELRVNKSIADIVIINGESCVYEIKSEYDSPQRLISQINDYFQVFDKVYLVLSEKDIKKYQDLVNKDVGIMVLSKEGNLDIEREAQINPSLYNHDTILKTLRKPEYSAIIQKHYEYLPNVPNTLFFKECKNLFQMIPIDELLPELRHQWKNRKIKEVECFSNYIPDELKYMCWHLNLSKKEYSKLLNILQFKIGF